MGIKKFIIRQKFRFDTALTVLTFINFLLLSITASATIKTFLLETLKINIPIKMLVFYLFFGVIISVWLIGYLLDKYVQYPSEIASVNNSRNIELTEILNNTRELLKK